MSRRVLHGKRYAHERAYNHGDMKQCNNIIAELEAGGYCILAKLLVDCEWQAAYEWIEKNM